METNDFRWHYDQVLKAIADTICSGNTQSKLAWLRPPKYFLSIFISLQYYVWVCGIFLGFLRPNVVRPISEQRAWLRTMSLKSALVDRHLHARCLVRLQPAHKVIPGQMVVILIISITRQLVS